MNNTFVEKMKRCSNLMADYKGMFGKNVPIQLLFYDIETISDRVEEALKEGKEIEWEEE